MRYTMALSESQTGLVCVYTQRGRETHRQGLLAYKLNALTQLKQKHRPLSNCVDDRAGAGIVSSYSLHSFAS